MAIDAIMNFGTQSWNGNHCPVTEQGLGCLHWKGHSFFRWEILIVVGILVHTLVSYFLNLCIPGLLWFYLKLLSPQQKRSVRLSWISWYNMLQQNNNIFGGSGVLNISTLNLVDILTICFRWSFGCKTLVWPVCNKIL